MTGLPDLVATVACVGLTLGACLLLYVFWPRRSVEELRRERARERAELTSEQIPEAVTIIEADFVRHR